MEAIVNERGLLDLLSQVEQLSLQGKSNFFEKRVGDYRKAGIGTAENTMSTDIAFDEEF